MFGTEAHHLYFTITERQIGDYFLSIRKVPATRWHGFGTLCEG
jgi:hypothetical protein